MASRKFQNIMSLQSTAWQLSSLSVTYLLINHRIRVLVFWYSVPRLSLTLPKATPSLCFKQTWNQWHAAHGHSLLPISCHCLSYYVIMWWPANWRHSSISRIEITNRSLHYHFTPIHLSVNRLLNINFLVFFLLHSQLQCNGCVGAETPLGVHPPPLHQPYQLK